MGAFLVSDRLIQEIKELGGDSAVFSNGFTYSGHPVAAAAGIKNLEIMKREKLFEQVQETGPYMQQQLQALEALLLKRKLQKRVLPSGRPVKSGWISSFFGRRSDPMTGKQSMHKGIDFAAKYGAEVVAVSDGVVVSSRKRSGFGNTVEIRHGDGYMTRYAHNQENLVTVGEQVIQGQTIAYLGSTGRSTGPHVHFEVWQNGRPVDPSRYIQ